MITQPQLGAQPPGTCPHQPVRCPHQAPPTHSGEQFVPSQTDGAGIGPPASKPDGL